MPLEEDELLARLWHHINACTSDDWIDGNIRQSERQPDAPFADAGVAFKRLLALGASKQELASLVRVGCFDGVFATLCEIPDLERQGLDTTWKRLRAADPSGLKGRPGPAAAIRRKPEA